MNTYIIIGAPGQGKSPWVRRFIEGRRCLVWDIQNEYGERTKYPGQKPVGLNSNTNDIRSRYIGDSPDMFCDIVLKKVDTICVFEEATVFFEGRTKEKLRKVLINKFHTRNVYLFIFHSIASVPPRILQMCNYVVLFKTLDQFHNVATKFGQIAPHFAELQGKPDGECVVIKLI